MSNNTFAQTVAAELVTKLPTAKTLTVAKRSAGDTLTGTTIVGTFIGSSTYDIGFLIADESIFAGVADEATVLDIAHQALNTATTVLGSGVLTDVRIDSSSDLPSRWQESVALDGENGPAGFLTVSERRTAATVQSTEDVKAKLGRINNVEMALTVEIGRTRMPVRDVLSLEPGAIVELDRSAGAPADILLNGRLIAFGEIVVVDQDYAVRVTQILDTQDALA